MVTLFPSDEDMTSAPVYDEFDDPEVEHIEDLRANLWSDPPRTPRDNVNVPGSTDPDNSEDDKWSAFMDELMSGRLAE